MDLKSAESECENHEMQIFQIKNDKNAVSNLSEASDCLPVIPVVFFTMVLDGCIGWPSRNLCWFSIIFTKE